jgi:hypothetical protein
VALRHFTTFALLGSKVTQRRSFFFASSEGAGQIRSTADGFSPLVMGRLGRGCYVEAFHGTHRMASTIKAEIIQKKDFLFPAYSLCS